MLKQIISGGQTGVDQAALDAAIALNIPHGGWCPKGRRAENGVIPARFLLKETESDDYSVRTQLNIQYSDGTLIFVPSLDAIAGGTALTIEHAKAINKPHLIINLVEKIDNTFILHWISHNNIETLNIAGPRESNCPGIYATVLTILKDLF